MFWPMTHPDYIREKAIEFRIERQMSIDEIAERLALSKTTVYYWVRDIPLQREVNRGPAQVAAAAAKEAKWDRMRDEAYAEGWEEYDQLLHRATFQQFVVLYIAEGSKRDRNRVAVANSDVHVMKLATSWIRYLTMHKLGFAIRYHADQDLDELRQFWGTQLGFDGSIISMQRKSNSGQLGGRSWRSQYGALTVSATDTLLRARLQAWMDRIRLGWSLDCALHQRGVAQPG